jgi:hypothetical protein
MANTQINYACACPILSTPIADAVADLEVYPLDPILTLPYLYGLLLVSYTVTTPVGGLVQANATFRMIPTVGDAVATATLVGGPDVSGAPVLKIVLGGGGAGGLYARPPIVGIVGAAERAAEAHAVMQVGGTVVAAGGKNYNAADTTAAFVGGSLAPGGIPAVAGAVTVVANAVTAVAVTTPGGPYDQPPQVVITDSSGAGSGAVVMAGLSVASVALDYPGVGYIAAPAITFTPLFKAMVPDSAGDPAQVATMAGWFVQAMQALLSSPAADELSIT